MIAEQQLWQGVVIKAIIDGLSSGEIESPRERLDRRESDAWIRRAGQDFRDVCSMAGLDPQFVRDAYTDGRISLQALNNFDKWMKERAAA